MGNLHNRRSLWIAAAALSTLANIGLVVALGSNHFLSIDRIEELSRRGTDELQIDPFIDRCDEVLSFSAGKSQLSIQFRHRGEAFFIKERGTRKREVLRADSLGGLL
jgi:hypothetical protein